MKNYTVYMHTSPKGKRYIGITCRKPEYRWNHGRGYQKNQHFFNAILKYGWDNFEHTIIASDISKEEACSLEQTLIEKHQTHNPKFGYNRSTGGECGGLGVVFSDERRRKVGEAHKGMTHTEDVKKRLSEAHKGLPTWNKGRSWTAEEKQTMAEAQKTRKAVICIETGIIYLGVRDAERQTGINRCSIKDCCHGRKHNKSAGGYHWAYACEQVI